VLFVRALHFVCVPEELFPKEACDDAKSVMRAKQIKWTGPMNPKPHAMADGRVCRSRRLRKNCTSWITTCPRRSSKRKFLEPAHPAAQAKRWNALYLQGESW